MIVPSPLTKWPHEEGGGEYRKKPLEANDGREVVKSRENRTVERISSDLCSRVYEGRVTLQPVRLSYHWARKHHVML